MNYGLLVNGIGAFLTDSSVAEYSDPKLPSPPKQQKNINSHLCKYISENAEDMDNDDH